MGIVVLPPSPSGQITHGQVREKVNEVIGFTNFIDLNDEFSMAPDPVSGVLSLYRTEGLVTEFVGEIGGGYTDQLVFTKPLGGVRFFDPVSGFEYFAIRRDVSGDTLGAVFGNLDTASGNYFATSEVGGFNFCQKTNTDLVQNIGNAASTNYIDATLFSFQLTSDQVKPYGALLQGFVGETDVDFVDVPFDVRILDSTGTIVYSDVQNIELFKQNPSASAFKLSSAAGVVNLPPSQPFPMDSSATYTVEYEFATPIRLKGDGSQPALSVNSKRLEYYRANFTSSVDVFDSNFVAESGGSYKVDTTGGSVIATVHPTVKSLTVGDFDLTWTNTNKFTLDTVFGNIDFGTSQKGKRFEVVRRPSEYRVYNADGSLEFTVP